MSDYIWERGGGDRPQRSLPLRIKVLCAPSLHRHIFEVYWTCPMNWGELTSTAQTAKSTTKPSIFLNKQNCNPRTTWKQCKPKIYYNFIYEQNACTVHTSFSEIIASQYESLMIDYLLINQLIKVLSNLLVDYYIYFLSIYQLIYWILCR